MDSPKTWYELLEHTGFAKATLAKHIKNLLEKGLITEEVDKKDRRRKIYRINEKGFQMIEEDLLAIYISTHLRLYFSQLFDELELELREKPTNEAIVTFAKRICEKIGRIYFAAILGGEPAVRAVLKALQIYSKINIYIGIMELRIMESFLEEERKLLTDIRGEELLNAVVDVLVEDVSRLKGIELAFTTGDIDVLVSKGAKTHKEKEYRKSELEKFRQDLKDYIESLKEANPLLKGLISDIEKAVDPNKALKKLMQDYNC